MKNHRYNSPEARYTKVNRVFVLGGTLLFVVMFLYVLLYRNEVTMKQSIFIGNCVVLALFGVINMAVYLKSKATKVLRFLIAAEVCAEFVFYSMTTTAQFLGMALIGVMGSLWPTTIKNSSTGYWCCVRFYILQKLSRS